MNREEMLARFSRGTLNEAERRALFEAALDDQALFDALSEEDALRVVLDHPESRPALLTRLKPAPARSRGLRLGITMTAGAALAAALAIVLLRSPSIDLVIAARPPGPDAEALWSDGDTAAKAMEPVEAYLDLGVESRVTGGGTGTVGPARVRAGAALEIDVRVPQPAWVTVLLRAPDGSIRVLFPAEGPAVHVEPPGLRVTGPGGKRLAAPASPGRYQLRLVAVRDAAAPPGAAAIRAALASGEAAIVDVPLDVTPR
jgi:hypothetical protein